MLNFFVDNEKLKKLCVSTFESALAELFFFVSVLSYWIIPIFSIKKFIPPNFVEKIKDTDESVSSRSHKYNDPFFFAQAIFQYGESLTTHKILLGDKIEC